MRGQWITPANAPGAERVNWRISLPVAIDWLALLKGAVDDLRFQSNWEQTTGISAEDAAATFAEIFDSMVRSDMIGTIVAYATSSPPSGCLACDGSTHLRVDYPALYAVLAPSYIADGDHFHVPDLRGRAIIGVGTGPGLTARAMNDSGGAEKHALSVAELAQHHHTYVKPTAYIAVGGTGNQAVYPAFSDNTGDTGSGTAHENMQPWSAVGYAIVAE